MIKTVLDLKKALELISDNTEIRTISDAGGNYYFPNITLKDKFIDGKKVLLFTQEGFQFVENTDKIK